MGGIGSTRDYRNGMEHSFEYRTGIFGRNRRNEKMVRNRCVRMVGKYQYSFRWNSCTLRQLDLHTCLGNRETGEYLSRWNEYFKAFVWTFSRILHRDGRRFVLVMKRIVIFVDCTYYLMYSMSAGVFCFSRDRGLSM